MAQCPYDCLMSPPTEPPAAQEGDRLRLVEGIEPSCDISVPLEEGELLTEELVYSYWALRVASVHRAKALLHILTGGFAEGAEKELWQMWEDGSLTYGDLQGDHTFVEGGFERDEAGLWTFWTGS